MTEDELKAIEERVSGVDCASEDIVAVVALIAEVRRLRAQGLAERIESGQSREENTLMRDITDYTATRLERMARECDAGPIFLANLRKAAKNIAIYGTPESPTSGCIVDGPFLDIEGVKRQAAAEEREYICKEMLANISGRTGAAWAVAREAADWIRRLPVR